MRGWWAMGLGRMGVGGMYVEWREKEAGDEGKGEGEGEGEESGVGGK